MIDQQILLIFGAIFAGLTVTSVFSRVNLSLSTSPSSLLADYVAHDVSPDWVEQFGRWLLRRYPSLTALINLERHSRWLALSGRPPSTAAVLGLAVLLASGGAILTGLTGIPLVLGLSVIGIIYPGNTCE